MDSLYIKKIAKEYGADLVGVGDVSKFDGTSPRHDPRYILPTAKCVIGFAFRIHKGTIRCLENQSQIYNYTALGVKANSEEKITVFLLRMARIIENEGYEACIQRSSPNIQTRDQSGTNPEISGITWTLDKSISVAPGKPEPEVLLDFDKAGVICGMGTLGYRGQLLTKEFGPMQRLAFLVTNAPLEPDLVIETPVCDNCGKCVEACPGSAIIDEPNPCKVAGMEQPCRIYDKWQCSVYYRGAHKSNPLIKDDFLKDHPFREEILNGTKRFTEEEAVAIYPELDFLPKTQYGYVPCLCGKRCDIACYRHLMERKRISKEESN